VQLLEKSGNKLDVVVNNAGMASAGLSEPSQWSKLAICSEVNVFGVQRGYAFDAARVRAKRAGLVINVGSILGRVTLPFFGCMELRSTQSRR